MSEVEGFRLLQNNEQRGTPDKSESENLFAWANSQIKAQAAGVLGKWLIPAIHPVNAHSCAPCSVGKRAKIKCDVNLLPVRALDT